MMRKQSIIHFCVLCMLAIPFCATAQKSNPSLKEQHLQVQGGPYELFGRAFTAQEIDRNPVLVIVLHGDAPPPHEYPSYQNIFASKVVAMNENVVAVGLLRPGYTDPDGNHSEGIRGQMNGDNWNKQNTDSIADAIAKLKDRFKAEKVIVAGHSGGAAITANILGRHPDLIDVALLVSCPCGDLESWRESMLKLTGASAFKGKINTLSPIEQIKGISDHVPITMIVGTKDKVAPPKFSKQYQKATVKAGKNVTLVKLKDQPHNTFLYSKVYSELANLISDIPADNE